MRLRFWIALFFLLPISLVTAQPIALLVADTLLPVEHGLVVFAEPAGPVAFSAVQPARFMALPNGNVDFGHTDRGGWVRVSVSNQVSVRQPVWVLRVVGISSTVLPHARLRVCYLRLAGVNS